MLQRTTNETIQEVQQEIDTTIDRIKWWQAVLSRASRVQNSKRDREARGKISKTPSLRKRASLEQTYQFKEITTSVGQENITEVSGEYYLTHYIEEFTPELPVKLQVQTRHNWVEKYLDHADNNVFATLAHQEQYQLLSLEEGSFYARSIKEKRNVLVPGTEVFASEYLTVSFPEHLTGYRLKTVQASEEYIYQLELQQQHRIILRVETASSVMQRLIVLKKIAQGHEIMWGNYSQRSFTEALLLEAGEYILLPLSKHTQMDIVIYCQTPTNIHIKADTAQVLKTFRLLMETFPQSGGCDLSASTVSLTEVKQSFARSCYLDLGIVIEVYQNIYPSQVLFIEQQPHEQDLQLLLTSIYSQQQREGRLEPYEKVVLFYSISAKPARMFIPHKKVIMEGQMMENITFHTVFK